MAKGRKSSGLFKPPKHRWLAELITFEDPKKARESAGKLVRGLKRGRVGRRKIGRKRALTTARALSYAANRAEASAKRRNLSAEERKELKEIARIYRDASKEAFEIYREEYRG